MKTLRDKQVSVTRTVKVGGQIYTIRNQTGSGVAADWKRASQKAAQKGEPL